MMQIKRTHTIIAAVALTVFMGLQTAQAVDIVPTNITDAASSYTTGDGLVTLTPLAAGLTPGTYGATAGLFGVAGGNNQNAIDDVDGDPATTVDREALDIDLDATVGLTQIAFKWSYADGVASNGVPAGVVISGFSEDPGVWTQYETMDSTYTNGTLYFDPRNYTGTEKVYGFTNINASMGQVLQVSVNDFDTAAPQAALSLISYGTEGVTPLPLETPNGYVSWSNVVSGATKYTSGDGLLTITPYSAGLADIGTFGVDATGHFGVQGGGSTRHIDDIDGDPATTADREALDLSLDGSVGLTKIAFRNSRANGAASSGVPAGIVISGFTEDPGYWTETSSVGTYANGAIYIDIAWSGTPSTFYFTNLTASAGQTLRIGGNDTDDGSPWLGVNYIGFDDEPILPPPPPPPADTSNSFVINPIAHIQGGPNNNQEANFDWDAVYDNSGLSTALNTGDAAPETLPTHVVPGNAEPFQETAARMYYFDALSTITFDLGTTNTLNNIIVWNGAEAYAGVTYNNRGMAGATVSFSTDGITFGDEMAIDLALVADSLDPYAPEVFGVADVDARYVRLSAMSNQAGGNYFLALSELRFTSSNDSLIPEPAVLTMTNQSGQMSVTADNMKISTIVTLQGADNLIYPIWVDIASTTGVEQVTWPVDQAEIIRFYRVKSE